MFISFVISVNLYETIKLTEILTPKIKPNKKNSNRSSHIKGWKKREYLKFLNNNTCIRRKTKKQKKSRGERTAVTMVAVKRCGKTTKTSLGHKRRDNRAPCHDGSSFSSFKFMGLVCFLKLMCVSHDHYIRALIVD